MCQREGEAKRGKRERRRREIGRMNRRNREVEKGKGKGKRKGREWKGGGGDSIGKEVYDYQTKTWVGGMCMLVTVIKRVISESLMNRRSWRREDTSVIYTVPDIPNTQNLEYIILKNTQTNAKMLLLALVMLYV